MSAIKFGERDGINLFWSIKNSAEVLNKFKSRGFIASKLSTDDFSTLFTSLPHLLIKDKLNALIQHTFTREKTLYLACNEERAFSLLMYIKIMNYHPVKTFVKPMFILWIMLTLDLELKFIEKL